MSPSKVVLPVGPHAVCDAVSLELAGREPLALLLERAQERGRAEAEAQAPSGAAQLLNQATSRLEEEAQGLSQAAAKTALELGLVIAREFVLREVEQGEHDIEGMVRSVLAAASSDRGRCVVHVHPTDAATLAGVEFRPGTTVEADAGVRKGDVQVETSMGLMVRELDETLRNLSTRLREELR